MCRVQESFAELDRVRACVRTYLLCRLSLRSCRSVIPPKCQDLYSLHMLIVVFDTYYRLEFM